MPMFIRVRPEVLKALLPGGLSRIPGPARQGLQLGDSLRHGLRRDCLRRYGFPYPHGHPRPETPERPAHRLAAFAAEKAPPQSHQGHRHHHHRGPLDDVLDAVAEGCQLAVRRDSALREDAHQLALCEFLSDSVIGPLEDLGSLDG